MSIVSDAIRLWADCRSEFENYRLSEYARAAEACRGRLLNRRGMRANIEALSLFMGNEIRAHAYASEELLEHWRRHPRPTYERFERQWVEIRENERYGY
jgi:hypothetical protein